MTITFGALVGDHPRRLARHRHIGSDLPSGGEPLKQREQELPASYIEQRNRHWDRWNEQIQNMPVPERFEAQKANSLSYLAEWGLEVRELKERLARLKFYKGKIDNDFTPDLVEAIEQFQRYHNMRHVDGMFGPLTLEKLNEKLIDSSRHTRTDT